MCFSLFWNSHPVSLGRSQCTVLGVVLGRRRPLLLDRIPTTPNMNLGVKKHNQQKPTLYTGQSPHHSDWYIKIWECNRNAVKHIMQLLWGSKITFIQSLYLGMSSVKIICHVAHQINANFNSVSNLLSGTRRFWLRTTPDRILKIFLSGTSKK